MRDCGRVHWRAPELFATLNFVMNKSNILITAGIIVIILLAGGIFLSKERGNQGIQVEIDPNVDHWQTKETEAFSIKFPKEWYWMESDPTKHGYPSNSGRSYVITNNPDFDIDKYSDIGIFSGGDYPVILTSDSEVVISHGGWATTNAGTPRDFMEGELKRVKEDVNHFAKCHYVSDIYSIPLTAFCSFVDEKNNQKVDTYYISYEKLSLGFTSRTTTKNTLELEPILGEIARSYALKNASN